MVINTSGELPAVGDKAPNFSLVDGRLGDVNLATYSGKLNIGVPQFPQKCEIICLPEPPI